MLWQLSQWICLKFISKNMLRKTNRKYLLLSFYVCLNGTICHCCLLKMGIPTHLNYYNHDSISVNMLFYFLGNSMDRTFLFLEHYRLRLIEYVFISYRHYHYFFSYSQHYISNLFVLFILM